MGQSNFNDKDLQQIFGPNSKSLLAEKDKRLAKCCAYGQIRPGEEDFMEGPGGIVLYGPLYYGISDFLKSKNITPIKKDFYDITYFEQFSLIKIFRSGKTDASRFGDDNSEYFGSYNPQFILWIKENLIPEPDLVIYGRTAQSIYSYYKRFFRLMTESYLFITKKSDYYLECNLYTDKYISDKDFNGLLYLKYRYSGQLKGYEIPSNSYVPSPFTDYMAIGFWLRRGIDSTDDIFYETLAHIMSKYDKDWFTNITHKYK